MGVREIRGLLLLREGRRKIKKEFIHMRGSITKGEEGIINYDLIFI